MGIYGRTATTRRARPGALRRIAVGTTAALMATVLAAAPALGHGVIDQQHAGDSLATPCSAAEYPGTKLLTTGESRQSFVPSRGGVASVEVCIENLIGIVGNDFTVNIYDGGTATSPGPLLASKPYDAGLTLLSAQWVHIDLPDVVTVPGATYVLGLAPGGGALSSVTFQWRATCNDSLLQSCSGVPDAYPQGNTNDLPGNADYAFRTFPLHDADLVGEVTVADAICPNLDLTGYATGAVRNVSQTSVGPFATEWAWSSDTHFDPGDLVIAGSRHEVPGIAAGGTASIPAPHFPTGVPHGEGHLLLRVDVDEQVVESDDANNVAAGLTTVTHCGQPAIEGLALDVTQTQVTAGFHQLQFSDLDSAALATLPQSPAEASANPGISPNGFSPNGFSPNGFSANGFSPNGFSPNGFSPNGFSPNGFSPNGFSPNGFSPNGFSPAGDILLSDVLSALPALVSQQALVVNVPIAGAGWGDRLVGLTDEPVQNITLAKASALLPGLTLGEVDLTRVITMSWMGLALAKGRLNDTPLPDGKAWCTLLSEYGFSCADVGVNANTTSLLQLEATGFPTHQAPIADRPLSTINRNASFMVFDTKLAGTPRFNLEHTRLGRVPADVALTDPSTVIDCASFDCSRRLAEASAEGAFRDVTVRTLVQNLSPAGLAAGTVGDLAMGLAPATALQLSSANWNHANPYFMDESCSRVTYELRGRNTGTAPAVNASATVTLAPGFAYVPGTAVLRSDGGPASPQAEPASQSSADGSRTYTFQLDAQIAESFTLSYQACAGVYLGHFGVGTATVDGTGIEGPYTANTDGAAADTILVVERTPGATTQTVTPENNVVIADHISSANAHDSWTFGVKPEPRTLYVVKLFSPLGVDLDLIGYGPGVSASGFSANGFSPNGFSPNGFSPNGFSANGFSPNGFSANGFSPNGFSPNGFSATGSPDMVDDVAVDELAPANSSGHALSANRGDTPETLYMFSTFGDEGSFTFTVTDYNGARSDAPYFLTIQAVQPTRNPLLDTCDPAPWDLTQQAGAAPATWNGSQPPRTLFVTNRQVTASVHGATAANSGLAALQELAARPEVRGIVLNVDHNPDVRAAYAAWRNDWCNPTAANRAATHVRSLILNLRNQHPTIDTIVIAGGDEIVPDFRLSDGSVLANEVHYVDALLNATGGNNALVAAFANGTIPSSDPYGNKDPLPFGTSFAFPPSAGVSRLVETPADWIAQKDQYLATNGKLDPGKGFISAYEGMVDGAEAAADVLTGAGVPTTRLTDETGAWTAAQFRAGAFGANPDIAGYNAHANHWGILSAAGSVNDDISQLVTTAESSDIPFGGLIFSNGCHFGTSVPDSLNATPTPSEQTRLLDWNQAIAQRRGIAVTNSGFGIFDTEEIGQGERLQVLFLEEAATAPNVAVALARAKNRFFATPGVYDAYSFKTLQQLSMYGLGIFSMFGATEEPPAAAPAATDSIDISVGPFTVATSGSSTCTRCYLLSNTPAGRRVQLRDPDLTPGHTSTSGYWSAPLSTQEVRLPAGMLSAGIWFNALDSVTIEDVDPVITRLAVNRSDRETESQTAAPFPTALGMVNDVGGTAFATLLHGINVPTRKANGKVRSDMHLYTEIDAELLLRPDSTIGCTPLVDEVTVAQSENGSLVMIDVVASELCGPNVRAAALARDDLGNWTTRELAKDANGHWTAAVALSGGATEVEDLHIQVSNGRGVGHWRNKGDRPLVQVATVEGVELLLAGSKHSSGVYLGNVQATIVGAPNVSYRVYDNDHFVGTFVHGSTFPVTGDGVHVIQVLGSDGSSYVNSIAIDGSNPTIVLRTPPAGAEYAKGEQVRLDVSCLDTGTGASCSVLNDGQPISDGDLIRTDTPGQHTIVVNATDQVGHSATQVVRSYTVTAGYVTSGFLSPTKNKPLVNTVSPGSNIALKFVVTDADGNHHTDPAIIASRTWQPISCQTKAPTGSPFPAAGTTPEYSGFFHFNTTAPATKGCYEMIVRLDDGTTISAYFEVKGK